MRYIASCTIIDTFYEPNILVDTTTLTDHCSSTSSVLSFFFSWLQNPQMIVNVYISYLSTASSITYKYMIHNKIHDKITIMDTGLIEAINNMNTCQKIYKKKEASSCWSFIYEEDLLAYRFLLLCLFICIFCIMFSKLTQVIQYEIINQILDWPFTVENLSQVLLDFTRWLQR